MPVRPLRHISILKVFLEKLHDIVPIGADFKKHLVAIARIRRINHKPGGVARGLKFSVKFLGELDTIDVSMVIFTNEK